MLVRLNPGEPPFEFEPVANEEQLNELDYRLATDSTYQSNLTNWLNKKILGEEPNGRLVP